MIARTETKEFGTVLLIAVAATMVGSINFNCECKAGANSDLKAQDNTKCTDGRCLEGKQINKFDPFGQSARVHQR